MEPVISPVAVIATVHITVTHGVVVTWQILKSHYNRVIISTWTRQHRKMKLRDLTDNNYYEVNF